MQAVLFKFAVNRKSAPGRLYDQLNNTTDIRMKQLFEERTTPRNRDENELMGYRDVLNTIHESFEYIPVRPSYILQLHRDLMRRAHLTFGGNFKNVQNYINETRSDGSVIWATERT